MCKRFVSIWFTSLKTDWMTRRQPNLVAVPFVLAAPEHGRLLITAANDMARGLGAFTGQVLADARAIIPGLQYFDDEQNRAEKILTALGEWLIRYTPVTAIDLPDGLLMDVTGCAHLWGGEKNYLAHISKRLTEFGYHTQMALSDTIGASWAIARYGSKENVIETGAQARALLNLPSSALRLENENIERLEKLGLRQISQFMNMPRTALRRRFGPLILKRLAQAMGKEEENIQAIYPAELYQERLPSPEPIVNAKGIEIALERLLTNLCSRLQVEEIGLRKAVLTCYRVDGKMMKLFVGTIRPSHNQQHLFKLFKEKIDSLEPGLGIELFTMDAQATEPLSPQQEKLFHTDPGLNDKRLGELLDRITGKFGEGHIQRFLPARHYWPERSYQPASELNEQVINEWKVERPRPIQLLQQPALIVVAAPVPDYPPMNFRYKNKLHKIIKADGPERIEPEWWLQDGQHRDYYYVEDEEGQRYWIFRLGHYDAERSYQWFLHGFFA